MPTVLTPDGSGTSVSVPNAGENRTAASVRTGYQALLNLNEALRQDFQGSIHDKFEGSLGDPTGALSQATTTSYVALSLSGGSDTIACLVGDDLWVSWVGNFHKGAGGVGDIKARIRLSSPSLAAVTIAENRVSAYVTGVEAYGSIPLVGTHACAFNETYTATIEIIDTGVTPNNAVFSSHLHIHRVR